MCFMEKNLDCFPLSLLENLQGGGDCSSSQALKFIQGLCLALNCIGEVPMFAYAGI